MPGSRELVITLTPDALMARRDGEPVPSIDQLLVGIPHQIVSGDPAMSLSITVSARSVDRVKAAVGEFCVVDEYAGLELLAK